MSLPANIRYFVPFCPALRFCIALDGLGLQVEGNELRITCDLVCSRVLEQLIRLCTTAQLTKLFASFVPVLERMLTNRYASHVLQMMVITCAPLITPDQAPDAENSFTEGEEAVTAKEGATLITLFDYLCRSFMLDLPGYVDPCFFLSNLQFFAKTRRHCCWGRIVNLRPFVRRAGNVPAAFVSAGALPVHFFIMLTRAIH